MPEKLYSLQEACEFLGVSPSTIRRWEKAGKIRCVKTPGGHRRVPESEIQRIQGVNYRPRPAGVMYKVIEKDGKKTLIPIDSE
jgi:putative resolvase